MLSSETVLLHGPLDWIEAKVALVVPPTATLTVVAVLVISPR